MISRALQFVFRGPDEAAVVGAGTVGTSSGLFGFLMTPEPVRWVPFGLGVLVSLVTIWTLVVNRREKRVIHEEELRLTRIREQREMVALCNECRANVACPVPCAVPAEYRPENCPARVSVKHLLRGGEWPRAKGQSPIAGSHD